MKLYYAPGACSLAVHIALREIGAPFDAVAVDLATHKLADGSSYLDVAPRGYVPVLEFDDGTRHSEAAALLQFVADSDPARTLIGEPGTTRRLAATEWLAFVATELHKTFSPWLWHKETADSTRQAAKEKLAARFAELDTLLAGQDFLAGDYSVADAYAFTIVNWANFLALPLTRYPRLTAYLARVASRPAVQAALRAEGLVR
ncbi:glutathione transferase GstA [Piscinibacter koreensis]|uniref:Glutathione transferase GstA n=1 Tax=Piscinibacter koreensis TaxID=2742824 RepID=A0A7Y6TWJ1_9BURK|nr:glutathione transferase GstA [Schlegelella koreensis]NUZ06051.1 glutathione transferase GstA [Schlegelella koreensis]